MLNLAPERFRVAHAAVPFVDALTTMLQPDLPLTVGEWEEWGNPLADPEVYAAMRAYAPYENVRAADYPAVLATSSLHDTRVYVTEPAKWVARLRETVTSDPQRPPGAAAHRAGRRARWAQRPVRRVGADRVGVGVRARPARRDRTPLTLASSAEWCRACSGGGHGRGQWTRLIRRSAVDPTCRPANPPEPRLPTTSRAAPSVRSTSACTGSERTTS